MSARELIEGLRDDLPARTLGRRVGLIVQGGGELSAAVVEIAQLVREARTGSNVWPEAEAVALVRDLEACESRLDRWLCSMSGALTAAAE